MEAYRFDTLNSVALQSELPTEDVKQDSVVTAKESDDTPRTQSVKPSSDGDAEQPADNSNTNSTSVDVEEVMGIRMVTFRRKRKKG